MIALDTNVVVRFLVEDDKAQSTKAAKLIKRAMSQNKKLFISDIVLCESVWVLKRLYKLKKEPIISVLRHLLRAGHLAFVDEDRVARALDSFEEGKGDFADYMIAEHASSAGFEQVATFDKNLLKEDRFVSP